MTIEQSCMNYRYLYTKSVDDDVLKVWGAFETYSVIPNNSNSFLPVYFRWINGDCIRYTLQHTILFNGNIFTNKFKFTISERSDRMYEYAAYYRKHGYTRILGQKDPSPHTIELVNTHYPKLHEGVLKYVMLATLKN
jgi:hypothetical protein